jgi:RNA polymerase sigma-70 factor (ECF subfamily)
LVLRRESSLERARFEEMALEHLDVVHRMAMHLAREPNEAADLVQETYLRALRSADGFQERGGGIRAWLFTILHNTFYSRVKRAKNSPMSVGEFFGAEADGSAPDAPPPAWDLASFDWEHVDERLREAVDELRPEHREALLLWGVEGLKYREIAAITGVPIGTVMSRLHRARKILADQLEPLTDELGIRTGTDHDQ